MTPLHALHAPMARVQSRAPRRSAAVDLPVLRQRTRDLLAAHVPLALLLDLAEPKGPDSAGCYAREGGDTTWLPTG